MENINFELPKVSSEFIDSYQIEKLIFKSLYNNYHLKLFSNSIEEYYNINDSIENRLSRNMNHLSFEWKEELERYLETKDDINFLITFGSLFFQYLGTEERLFLARTQQNYGSDEDRINFLSSIKEDMELLEFLSNEVKKLFNLDIFLDKESLGSRLVFRVGENFENIRKSSR